ncbi:MAG: histone deacetylase family protein [Orrella sp.]|jgi:acetoin utilization deacetylase AcuC-like enzyme
METLYITHPLCKMHEMGSGHPECPERLDAISDQLLASGLINYLQSTQAQAPATLQALKRVHLGDYLDRLSAQSPIEGYREIDADTSMNRHSLQAAGFAAGAVIQAVDAVMAGHSQTAFCAVRPPGHHATQSRAMGFCFYNNIAVAAAHALAAHNLKRVAIIDFDVHHGNGTEAIFAGDERVLMCSFFQHPLFPGSGVDDPAANMVNIPVPAYTTGEAIRALVREKWLPRLQAHAPEMVFISAGFDAHLEEDMAQLNLVESDFAWLTEQIVAVADRHAQGRVISSLEGGYNLSALARSVVAHVRALAKL